MVIKHTLIFPFASAINFFSVTALMILAGLLGNAELAAEIAIVQGAIIAIFLSLSGNARNNILASNSHAGEKSILYFRLIVLLPALIAVYYLSRSAIEIPGYLIIGLVVRKTTEWFAELQLANRELDDDFHFGLKYALINSIGFILIGLALMAPSMAKYFSIVLYLWAFLPAILTLPYIRYIANLKTSKLDFLPLIPHMGSTVIIGVSTYIFRVLIVILAGKFLAGQMFVAYALGGVVSSLYAQAIGPTLMLKNSGSQRILLFAVISCIALGGAVVLLTLFWQTNLYPSIFMLGVGLSLMGGGVMIVAQRQRLYILQVHKKDVFVPDALSNIILISSITIAFNFFGEISLAIFFLWSALLAFFFYMPLTIRIEKK